MAKFRTKNDLKILWNDGTVGFKHANVTGISAIPNIRVKGEDTPDEIESGEVVIVKSSRAVSISSGRFRNERYIVDGFTHYDNNDVTPTDQTLNEMMAELERVLDLNTEDVDAEYDYEFIQSDELGPVTKGKHDWRIEATRRWTRRDGT